MFIIQCRFKFILKNKIILSNQHNPRKIEIHNTNVSLPPDISSSFQQFSRRSMLPFRNTSFSYFLGIKLDCFGLRMSEQPLCHCRGEHWSVLPDAKIYPNLFVLHREHVWRQKRVIQLISFGPGVQVSHPRSFESTSSLYFQQHFHVLKGAVLSLGRGVVVVIGLKAARRCF